MITYSKLDLLDKEEKLEVLVRGSIMSEGIEGVATKMLKVKVVCEIHMPEETWRRKIWRTSDSIPIKLFKYKSTKWGFHNSIMCQFFLKILLELLVSYLWIIFKCLFLNVQNGCYIFLTVRVRKYLTYNNFFYYKTLEQKVLRVGKHLKEHLIQPLILQMIKVRHKKDKQLSQVIKLRVASPGLEPGPFDAESDAFSYNMLLLGK